MTRLSDDELRDVLARAEEIERTTRRGSAWDAERAAVIGAGEEVGLSRWAIERALAERFNLPASPPVVGSLTWARSADGKFYVAEVLARHAQRRVGVHEIVSDFPGLARTGRGRHGPSPPLRRAADSRRHRRRGDRLAHHRAAAALRT